MLTPVEWIETLWPVILAGVMGLVGVFVGYRLSARRSVRLEHLNIIKAQVFQPIRDELKSFYLPLVQETLGPVTIEPRRKNLGGSINRPSVAWEYPIAPRRHAGREPRPFLSDHEQQRPEVNAELYSDAKSRHYPEFMNRYQAFKDTVTDYCSRWVVYAEYLSRVIAEKGDLPLVREQSATADTQWIAPHRLAVFVINWQLRIVLHAAWVPSDGLSVEIDGLTVARAENQETIQKLLDSLDVVSRDRTRLEELRQPLPELRHEANELFSQLERLLLSSRLPGRCALAKT